MTLTEKSLKRLGESMRIWFTEEQNRVILERFGAEPEPYEWSKQDIVVQIENFIGCGEFVKAVRSNGNQPILPIGMDF
ncbi:MAG: hypothetical protein KGZ75_04355 [Syntrophomonadaceae bacterium]|nr:hypothetical protein [Syntrophomonadaceae bacterium]